MLFGTDVAIKIVTIPGYDVKRDAIKEVEIKVGRAIVLLLLVKYVIYLESSGINVMGVCYEVSQLLLSQITSTEATYRPNYFLQCM